MAMGPVNRILATVPGFIPPEWYPAASNPIIKVSGAADRILIFSQPFILSLNAFLKSPFA
jgi:hypothetical protein